MVGCCRCSIRGIFGFWAKNNRTLIEHGDGNVFADLGLPNPDTHLVKADLVARIDYIIRKLGLAQAQAARELGLSQPDVSRLLRGRFGQYSVERLLRLLVALGRDVDIVIKRPRRKGPGRLRVTA